LLLRQLCLALRLHPIKLRTILHILLRAPPLRRSQLPPQRHHVRLQLLPLQLEFLQESPLVLLRRRQGLGTLRLQLTTFGHVVGVLPLGPRPRRLQVAPQEVDLGGQLRSLSEVLRGELRLLLTLGVEEGLDACQLPVHRLSGVPKLRVLLLFRREVRRVLGLDAADSVQKLALFSREFCGERLLLGLRIRHSLLNQRLLLLQFVDVELLSRLARLPHCLQVGLQRLDLLSQLLLLGCILRRE